MCCQPIWIQTEDDGRPGFYVPCGRCPECKAKRQNEWYLRFYCEDKQHRKNHAQTWFGTLTYDSEHLPHSRDEAVHDWQAFLKQLVRKLGVRPRFYVTTENGEKNGRIHFHFLLFNIPLDVDFNQFHKFIEDCWHRGFVQCCPAGGKQFTYISKYVTKDFKNDAQADWPIFQSSSKRPALGFEYASESLGEYLDSPDFRPVRVNGYPYSPTRYFRETLVAPLNLFEQKLNSPKITPPDSFYRNAVWREYYYKIKEAKLKKTVNNNKFTLKNCVRSKDSS